MAAHSCGGFWPVYNVQFDIDTKSASIAGVLVGNVGSDKGKMLPMSDALAGHYGERRRQHLVDGGFVKFGVIETLVWNGVDTLAPNPRDASRDRHAPQPCDQSGVADFRERMDGEAAKKIYKQAPLPLNAPTLRCAIED